MKKKLLSILLTVCMVLSMAPVTGYAADGDTLCEHHAEHTAECGYVEAVVGADCAHVHDDACGYAEPIEEVLCACAAAEDGTLTHAEGCGYVAPAEGSDCTHSHDETCGYVEAIAGSACTYECADCAAAEEEAVVPAEITGMSLSVDGVTYTKGDVTVTAKSKVIMTLTGTNFANLSDDSRLWLDFNGYTMDPVNSDLGWGIDAAANSATLDFASCYGVEYTFMSNKGYELRYSNDGKTTWIDSGIYLTYDDGTGSDDTTGGEENTDPAEITGVTITVDGKTYTEGNVTITPSSTIVYTVSGTNFANLSEENFVVYAPSVGDSLSSGWWSIDTETNTATQDLSDYISRFVTCNNFEVVYSNDRLATEIRTGIYLTYDSGIAEEDKAQITGVTITVDGETYSSGNVTITPDTQSVVYTVNGTNFANVSADNVLWYAGGSNEDLNSGGWTIDPAANTATQDFSNYISWFATCDNFEVTYSNDGQQSWIGTGIYLTYDDGTGGDDTTGGEETTEPVEPATLTGVSITVDGVEYGVGETAIITPDTESLVFTVTGENFAGLSETNMLNDGTGSTPVTDDYSWIIDTAANTATWDCSNHLDWFETVTVPTEVQLTNDGGSNFSGTGVYVQYVSGEPTEPDDGTDSDGGDTTEPATLTGVTITVDGVEYGVGKDAGTTAVITPDTTSIVYTITGENFAELSEDNRIQYNSLYNIPIDSGWTVDADANTATIDISHWKSEFESCTTAFEVQLSNDGGNTWTGTDVYVQYVSGTTDGEACTHENTTTATVDATCGVEGSVTTICNDCGEVIHTVTYPATGEHSYTNSAYLCDVCGAFSGTVVITDSSGQEVTSAADGDTLTAAVTGCDTPVYKWMVFIPATEESKVLSNAQSYTVSADDMEGSDGYVLLDVFDSAGNNLGFISVEYTTDSGDSGEVCEHTGGTATCTKQAVCDTCGESYGELNSSNHGELSDWFYYDHEQHYRYCLDCDNKEFGGHTGGTATCNKLAVCEVCGEGYGEYSSSNHGELSDWVSYDDTRHYRYCIDCGETMEYGDHSGGTATCLSQAICITCGNGYGAVGTVHSMTEWESCSADQHRRYCSLCVSPDSYEYEDHSGGTATCTEYAVCEVCDESYGLFGDTHTGELSDWEYCSTTQHCRKCSDCGKAAEYGDHSGGTATCAARAVCELCDQSYGDFSSSHGGFTEWTELDNDQHYRFCTLCTLVDSYEYVEHSWQGGSCTVCGAECIHSFENGSCIECGEEDTTSAEITGVSITIDGVTYDSTNTSAENPAVFTPETRSMTVTVHGTGLQNSSGDCWISCTPRLSCNPIVATQWTISEDGSLATQDAIWLRDNFTITASPWEIIYGNTESEQLSSGVYMQFETAVADKIVVDVVSSTESWNGAGIEVYKNGSLETTVTVTAYANSVAIDYDPTAVYEFKWVTGEGAAGDFTIYADGETMLEVSDVYALTSGETVLTLKAAAKELAITKQPNNASAKLGESFCVTVEAEGEGLTYQWYFRKVGATKWSKSSVTDNTYDDVMTKARHNREVYCVITDANGNKLTTDIATITGIKTTDLAIVTQPNDAGAKLGETFCVTVEAQGDGLTYQWYFRQAGTERWNSSGVRDNTYDDVMTKARHNREVYCVISDAWGNSVTSEIATISGIPTATLAITRQPESQTVPVGDMFNVTFDAVGDGLTYQWYFRQAGTETWRRSAQRDNSYDDVMTRLRHNRELYCVVTDAWGNKVETSPVVVIMGSQKHELQILTQPNDASAKLGEGFCVTVEAQGDGLTYQWYYRQAGTERWTKSGVRDNTYDDIMTKARHNREVYCVITDMWGNSVETDVATISGIETTKLAITQQPTDASAKIGESYCVTVEAEGDGLTYQWYFKNAKATKWSKSSVRDNTYDDVLTKTRAGRQVYCVITDAWGNTVTTDTVTLNAVQ